MWRLYKDPHGKDIFREVRTTTNEVKGETMSFRNPTEGEIERKLEDLEKRNRELEEVNAKLEQRNRELEERYGDENINNMVRD